jgi:hypothetical protein
VTVRTLGYIQWDAGSAASHLLAQIAIESFDNLDQRFELLGSLDS